MRQGSLMKGETLSNIVNKHFGKQSDDCENMRVSRWYVGGEGGFYAAKHWYSYCLILAIAQCH